jgi:tRNA A37 threonylcarbamoyltransferase TsaD
MSQEKYSVDTVVLAGGVSCNNRLKAAISEEAKKQNLTFHHPISNLYSMDNAAMVGILGYYKISKGIQ